MRLHIRDVITGHGRMLVYERDVDTSAPGRCQAAHPGFRPCTPPEFDRLPDDGLCVFDAGHSGQHEAHPDMPWPATDVLVLPCDACDRLVAAPHAHTHWHLAGCGSRVPDVGWCRCSYWLCGACCDCGGEAA